MDRMTYNGKTIRLLEAKCVEDAVAEQRAFKVRRLRERIENDA